MLTSSLQGSLVYTKLLEYCIFRLGYPECNVQAIRMNGVILKRVGFRL